MKVKKNLPVLEAIKCRWRKASVARTCFVGPQLFLPIGDFRGKSKGKEQNAKGKSKDTPMLAGFWTVRANWRVIIRFADRDVLDVDYVDYH